jgi:N-acetylneuraminate lyase
MQAAMVPDEAKRVIGIFPCGLWHSRGRVDMLTYRLQRAATMIYDMKDRAMKMTLPGLTPAVFTPMDASGELSLAVVNDYVDRLVAAGVGGLLVGGTTGEFASLSVAERRRLAEAFAKAAKDRVPMIVHVGCNDLPSTQELAAHAESLGADAIALAPPCFFNPPNVDATVKWCQSIAGSAPATPLFYYHIPSMTGMRMSMLEFLRSAVSRVDTLAGIKFTHEALDEYGLCVEEFGEDLTILFGRDELLLSGLAAGAGGAVGSSYNFALPLYQQIWKAFSAGDMTTARALQCTAVRLIETLKRYHYPAASKYCMSLIGLPCGQPRQPLLTLAAADEASLRNELEAMGFFDWALP